MVQTEATPLKFSIIMVARSETEVQGGLASLQSLESGNGGYEVILSTGNCPSMQRNRAAKVAQGEFLVFLDNDSEVHPLLLKYYLQGMEVSPQVAVVGGPSCLKKTANPLSNGIHLVFSSWFGLGPFRSRYQSLGDLRKATERDLILCNLCVKKKVFIAEKGFNENLYPNEENEFLNRLRDRYEMIHHPRAVVYRQQRGTLGEFIAQMLRYGKGRVKASLLRTTFLDGIFFIPLVFALYVTGLLFAIALATLNGWIVVPLVWSPFYLYLGFTAVASAISARSERAPLELLRLPFLFFLCHYWYGVGLVWGLVLAAFCRKLPPQSGEVNANSQVKMLNNRAQTATTVLES
ncbi:MAG TPA: hypothetical protein DCS07_09880 [Bdellovibrionales bacterium]|nr:hypothetical protein [Bdellovibrionales bacterium]